MYSIDIRTNKKTRHELSVHSFRKYFKTKAKIAGMKPGAVDTLMGHRLGISDTYIEPTEEAILSEYLKVVDALSINAAEKLKLEVRSLKSGILEHEDKKFQKLDQLLSAYPSAFMT